MISQASSTLSQPVTSVKRPPGNLCIFVGWQLNAGSYAAFSLVNGLPGTSRFGAALQVKNERSGILP